MKAGNFNINDYLEKLYEESTQMMDGGVGLTSDEGVIIPDNNIKVYQWLKKEYQKAQTEVKVEMKLGGAKFEPGYDLQTDLDSVKDFKPGMYGEIKTADTEKKAKGDDKKTTGFNLDAKKEKPGFQKGEGEEKEEKAEQREKKVAVSKSKSEEGDIKDKGESKKEEKPEKEESSDEDESKVKKVDLKTKKK
jgi:hypothetical protein